MKIQRILIIVSYIEISYHGQDIIVIEPVFLERTEVAVYIMIAFIVNTFEAMQTRFFFWSFKSREINLEISFTIPCYIFIVFEFSITFLALELMCVACKSCMFSFPAILTLWDIRVHVSISNSGNVVFYIEASFYE